VILIANENTTAHGKSRLPYRLPDLTFTRRQPSQTSDSSSFFRSSSKPQHGRRTVRFLGATLNDSHALSSPCSWLNSLSSLSSGPCTPASPFSTILPYFLFLLYIPLFTPQCCPRDRVWRHRRRPKTPNQDGLLLIHPTRPSRTPLFHPKIWHPRQHIQSTHGGTIQTHHHVARAI
jgi:hypothetical protein